MVMDDRSKAPASCTWRAIESRAAAASMMFRKADGTAWLLILVAAAALFAALYLI